MKTKPRIGCYVRVSTTKQDLASQRHAIREWARVNHVHTDDLTWYEDKKTGKTMDRVALVRLLKAVDCGKVDTVVVYDLSRFARTLIDGLKTLADVAKKCRVVSVSESIDFGTSSGMLVASIMLSVAQWQRETTVAKIKEGLAARRAAGHVLGRPRNQDRLTAIRKMYDDKGAQETIRHFGFSRANLYRALEKTREAV